MWVAIGRLMGWKWADVGVSDTHPGVSDNAVGVSNTHPGVYNTKLCLTP